MRAIFGVFFLYLIFNVNVAFSAPRIVLSMGPALYWKSKRDQGLLHEAEKKFPACRRVDICVGHKVHTYFFAPQLEHFFAYLLERKFVIAFFAPAENDIGEILIDHYLRELYAEDEYVNLVKEGQFKFYTAQENPGEPYFKDLSIILDDDEDLENTILIENQESFMPSDQKCAIRALKVRYFEDFFKCHFDITEHEITAINQVYYFLGIIDQCHALMTSEDFSLRCALATVLAVPKPQMHVDLYAKDLMGKWYERFPDYRDRKTRAFIDWGLNFVLQINKDAELYLASE